MNGDPGLDFGRLVVKIFYYPYYYRNIKEGTTSNKKSKNYGWHNNRNAKGILLRNYDRALAHGGYINHSILALQEAKQYIYFDDGSIGPSCLMEESNSAKKTHGDRCMADALTIEDKAHPFKNTNKEAAKRDMRTAAGRREALKEKKNKKTKNWRKVFDFRN